MTDVNHSAGLQVLLAAIAASPIVVPAPRARDFADWCERQEGADIDAVILRWLRSHAQQPSALS